MSWARIQTNETGQEVVFEIITVDPAGRYYPSLTWVVIPDGVTVNEYDLYANGTFSAPVATP